jgi:hypothetical protein
MSPELAWACGLFEGEGCAWARPNSANYRAKRPNGGDMRTVGMSVTSTDRDVLERFARVVGGPGRIYGPKNPGNREGTRPVYYWTTQRRAEVARLLTLFRPMLGERRGAKADEVLAYLKGR